MRNQIRLERDPSRPWSIFAWTDAVVTSHWFSGWTALAVDQSAFDLAGTPLPARTCLLTPPDTPISYRVVETGTQVWQLFQTEQGAIPTFEQPGANVFARLR